MDFLNQLVRSREKLRRTVSALPGIFRTPEAKLTPMNPNYVATRINPTFNKGENIRLDDRIRAAYPGVAAGRIFDRREHRDPYKPGPVRGVSLGGANHNAPILLDRMANNRVLQPTTPPMGWRHARGRTVQNGRANQGGYETDVHDAQGGKGGGFLQRLRLPDNYDIKVID